jgi:hypothetical protein
MSIKIVRYDLLNQTVEKSVYTDKVKIETRSGTAIESLLTRLNSLEPEEELVVYAASYSPAVTQSDLSDRAPLGMTLVATSQSTLYFSLPKVKAAIDTLIPLATQIPGYARGLFARGESAPVDFNLRVLIVDDATGENNIGIEPQIIKNIIGDGSSAIDRQLGTEMKLIGGTGLSQVRGYTLNPAIGNFYLKGTIVPLNLKNYFSSHGIDLDVDLVLSRSMLKGKTKDKPLPQLGIYEVNSDDLFLTKSQTIQRSTAEIGSLQYLFANGLAQDLAIVVQNEIRDLEQKKIDIVGLAEDYVNSFRTAQIERANQGKKVGELPGNVALIEAILETKNYGLLQLPFILRQLQKYTHDRVANIKTGNVPTLRGEWRPIVVSGELKHGEVAGANLSTGDRYIGARFPVLNRGQVQPLTVNNQISIFQNPDLAGVIPDALYVSRETLADIILADPERYRKIVAKYGSEAAAQAQWRSNIEAMKADFDGDTMSIFAESIYPNFYREVVENLEPDKLSTFVAKEQKLLIESDNLPEIIHERLKHYVGIINHNLSKVNTLNTALDFIVESGNSELKLETLRSLHAAYRSQLPNRPQPSLVDPLCDLKLALPDEVKIALDTYPIFNSTEYLTFDYQTAPELGIAPQNGYLGAAKEQIERLVEAIKAKALEATPVNPKQGLVFPPELIQKMEGFKYLKLGTIKNGEISPDTILTYLQDYHQIYQQLGKIIDLSQPVIKTQTIFDPDTNRETKLAELTIDIVPNYPFNVERVDEYLRDYQQILKICAMVIETENQKAVDYVKSGVAPNEGVVNAVVRKLPELSVGVNQMMSIVVDANIQSQVNTDTNLSINALFQQLRVEEVQPEIKSAVSYYRDRYQNLQQEIFKTQNHLHRFKDNEKPIILTLQTDGGNQITYEKTAIANLYAFRLAQGKGELVRSDSTIQFIPDKPVKIQRYLIDDNRQYPYPTPEIIRDIYLGEIHSDSDSIAERERVVGFRVENLTERIESLQKEAREILQEFRTIIADREWNEREVFTAIAQMTGEQAISQSFCLDALPHVLRDVVAELGDRHILVKAEGIVLTGEHQFTISGQTEKQLLMLTETNGKRQWTNVGNLLAYGNQLLDRTSFKGSLEPYYNQVKFTSINAKGVKHELRVGKLTDRGRELINHRAITDLRIERSLIPNYRLTAPEYTAKILDLAPELAQRLAPELAQRFVEVDAISLIAKHLQIYDDNFSATIAIEDKTYYLSGSNNSPLNKINRANRGTQERRRESWSEVEITIEPVAEIAYKYRVYSGDTKVGEITQTADINFWGHRFEDDTTSIQIPIQDLQPHYTSHQLNIDKNTLINGNVWRDAEVAHSYAKQHPIVQKYATPRSIERTTAQALDTIAILAETYCFHPPLATYLKVPQVDERGIREIDVLQLTIPDHKIDKLEAYLTAKHIPHLKLDRGIPNTYPETSRGYTVVRIKKDDLTPAFKTQISKQLGKPLTLPEYQAKLESLPITQERVGIQLNTLKNWIEQQPKTTNLPPLNLQTAKPVPYSLRAITSEIKPRFKGSSKVIDEYLVVEFKTARERDIASQHLGLPLNAEFPDETGKTRSFALVETGTLQTYLNDRTTSNLILRDRLKLDNPIINAYARTQDWTKLPARSQLDILMGTQANKYIGIPTEPKSYTAKYQANWGANANCTTYTPGDVVMVTGNRANTALGQELLKTHFQVNYLPLLQAAVSGGAKILCGNDGGIDGMVRDYLSDLGYDLHLHSAGFWEAKRDDCAISVVVETVADELQEEVGNQLMV